MKKVKSIGLFLCLWGCLNTILVAQGEKNASDSSSAVSIGETKTYVPTIEKNAEELMKEAITHFDGGRYQKSVECLDKAIEVNEFSQLTDILYFYRAVSKSKLNNHLGAIEDYTNAIKTNPYKSKYIYHRALAYFQVGEYDNAKNDFQATLAMDGENADIYLKLGFLKQQENDLKGAIEDYSKAIAFNPKLPDSYYYRGLIYLQVLLHDKACPDLKKAADLGHALALRQYDKYCD